MNNIPTTDKFIKDNPDYNRGELMVEFAKLHVIAALRQASFEAKTMVMYVPAATIEYQEVVDQDSIRNSYPLNLIK